GTTMAEDLSRVLLRAVAASAAASSGNQDAVGEVGSALPDIARAATATRNLEAIAANGQATAAVERFASTAGVYLACSADHDLQRLTGRDRQRGFHLRPLSTRGRVCLVAAALGSEQIESGARDSCRRRPRLVPTRVIEGHRAGRAVTDRRTHRTRRTRQTAGQRQHSHGHKTQTHHRTSPPVPASLGNPPHVSSLPPRTPPGSAPTYSRSRHASMNFSRPTQSFETRCADRPHWQADDRAGASTNDLPPGD